MMLRRVLSIVLAVSVISGCSMAGGYGGGGGGGGGGGSMTGPGFNGSNAAGIDISGFAFSPELRHVLHERQLRHRDVDQL